MKAGRRRARARGADRIRLEVPLDRRGVEVLQLEARRLARRYGVIVREIQVRKLERSG